MRNKCEDCVFIPCHHSILRYILHSKKTGFVVEHDFIMATYLADRVIVFEGRPSVDTTAHTPEALLNGMNKFLQLLGITFRRDPNNFRPRINKDRSVKVSLANDIKEFILIYFS
jgi:ATP-binding cassette subfamily E protein 1